MVKNATGGNKAKGFARKGFIKSTSSLRTAQEEGEIYCQVEKILGGSMCHVTDLNGKKYLCHIRGKFRGRGKRDNFVKVTTWVLVGLREWETESKGKLLNCDLIEVYTDSDKERLKNSVVSVNWSLFINNDTKINDVSNPKDNGGFEFADEKTQEYQDLIEAQMNDTSRPMTMTLETNEHDIVDFDDI